MPPRPELRDEGLFRPPPGSTWRVKASDTNYQLQEGDLLAYAGMQPNRFGTLVASFQHIGRGTCILSRPTLATREYLFAYPEQALEMVYDGRPIDAL